MWPSEPWILPADQQLAATKKHWHGQGSTLKCWWKASPVLCAVHPRLELSLYYLRQDVFGFFLQKFAVSSMNKTWSMMLCSSSSASMFVIQFLHDVHLRHSASLVFMPRCVCFINQQTSDACSSLDIWCACSACT